MRRNSSIVSIAKLKINIFFFLLKHLLRLIYYLNYNLNDYKLLQLPIYQPEPVKQYKSEYLFSLTSSPLRLLKIKKVFFNLPKNVPIVLNLPYKFKNKEHYDLNIIERLCHEFSQVSLNWVPSDLGPQTKLLGLFYANQELKKKLLNKKIIVIDDDTVYPSNIVSVYDSYSTANTDIYTVNLDSILGVNVHYGSSSYCVAYSILTETFITKCNEYSALRGCTFHDDYVFSAVFQDLQLKSEKISGIKTVQLPYGYDTDSLHFIEPNSIKSLKCGSNIWSLREQCPVKDCLIFKNLRLS